MRRRTALRIASVGLAAGVTGCLDSSSEPTTRPEYETVRTNDVDVPLVPLADAIEWYRDGNALFADARGKRQYRAAHITDAVHSPAPDGQSRDDPVEAEPTDRRIVTYCSCPHHLSSLRASDLIADGYRRTYALDEGFRAWSEAEYPITGTAVETTPNNYRIEGRVGGRAAADAGHVWAWHDPSGQREAAPIGTDGTFALTVRFYDVTPDSTIRLVAGSREHVAPLRKLASATVSL